MSASYTILDPASNPSSAPARIGSISFERDGNDVEFSWAAVAGADGYDVKVTEEDIGALDQSLQYYDQSGKRYRLYQAGGKERAFSD